MEQCVLKSGVIGTTKIEQKEEEEEENM
jgi:hypothetical protein